MLAKKRTGKRMPAKKIREIVFKAADVCLEKKAYDVVVLDLKNVSDMTDYFLVAEAHTDIHVRSVGDHLQERLREDHGVKPWHVEGTGNGRWVLLDYVDFVVHIFQPETRKFYQLERLWADAERFEIEDEEGGGQPEEGGVEKTGEA